MSQCQLWYLVTALALTGCTESFKPEPSTQVGDGDGGTLSCEQQVDLARRAFDQAVASADKSCVTNDDCVTVNGSTGCFAGCQNGYASEAGVASINAAVEALGDGLCEHYEDDCGELFALPCIPPRPALCDAGQCVEDDGTGGAECTTCLTTEVSWRITSLGILPGMIREELFTLSGCNDLTVTTLVGAECTSQLPQCPVPSGPLSIASLLTALENDEVVAALAAPGEYGAAQEVSGYAYQIAVGDRGFSYRTCAGADAGVDCPPEGGLEELRVLLDRIASESGSCEPGSETACTAPFDDGDCDALLGVYWHDPATGACMPRGYGGCGGNDNRYRTLEACQAACPPPAAQSDCARDRTLVDGCFACGVMGGCATTSPICSQQCTTNAPCLNEHGPLGAATTCDKAQGLCVMPSMCI